METCTHCTRGIADTEAPYLWQGAVVCAQCHDTLANQSPLETSPRNTPAFVPLIAAIAGLVGVLAGCLLMLAFHLTAADLIGGSGHAPGAGTTGQQTQWSGRAAVSPAQTAAFKSFIQRLATTMRTHDVKTAGNGATSRVTVQIFRWDVRATRSLRYPVQWLVVLQETQTFPNMRVPFLYRIHLVENDGRWKIVKADGRPRQSMVNHQAIAGQSYFSDCTAGAIGHDVAIAASSPATGPQTQAENKAASSRP